MSEEMKPCPVCQSPYGYFTKKDTYTCPECYHEWDNNVIVEEPIKEDVKDANGVILRNGDTIIVIKDLPVKGMAKKIKTGTKVKNIRLTTGEHNINCKIPEFGAMGLKSEFVKKT